MLQGQRTDLLRTVKIGGDQWEATVDLDQVNQRSRLRSYQFEDPQGLSDLGEYLLSMARDEGYGKVLAEVREEHWQNFLSRGFAPEGMIPGYFAGESAYTFSYFLDPQRQASHRLEKENQVLESVLAAPPGLDHTLDSCYVRSMATPDDIPELARLYDRVFTSFPTPLNDPAYLQKIIGTEAAVFSLIRDGDRLVSAAAAEVDWNNRNAEMTNCATLPDYRGEGLMADILQELEHEMIRREVGCLFSIARASSHGMNLVLRRLGYEFRGRLINNCHIMGDFEDMNIWVK